MSTTREFVRAELFRDAIGLRLRLFDTYGYAVVSPVHVNEAEVVSWCTDVRVKLTDCRPRNPRLAAEARLYAECDRWA